jgi:hypothetical protein
MPYDTIWRPYGGQRARRCAKCGFPSAVLEDRTTKESICHSCLPKPSGGICPSDPEDHERGWAQHLYPKTLTRDEIREGGSFA